MAAFLIEYDLFLAPFQRRRHGNAAPPEPCSRLSFGSCCCAHWQSRRRKGFTPRNSLKFERYESLSLLPSKHLSSSETSVRTDSTLARRNGTRCRTDSDVQKLRKTFSLKDNRHSANPDSRRIMFPSRSFRKSVSKQRTLTPFRIDFTKTPEG